MGSLDVIVDWPSRLLVIRSWFRLWHRWVWFKWWLIYWVPGRVGWFGIWVDDWVGWGGWVVVVIVGLRPHVIWHFNSLRCRCVDWLFGWLSCGVCVRAPVENCFPSNARINHLKCRIPFSFKQFPSKGVASAHWSPASLVRRHQCSFQLRVAYCRGHFSHFLSLNQIMAFLLITLPPVIE